MGDRVWTSGTWYSNGAGNNDTRWYCTEYDARFAEILLDIRTVPGISAEDVEKKIKKICRKEVEETNGEVKFEVRIKNERRAIEIAEEERWLKEFKAYLKQNGAETEEIGINYFTDASIWQKKKVKSQCCFWTRGA